MGSLFPRSPLIVAFVTLAVILATLPFADSGFDDDWAYAHVARVFHDTGTIRYNGWGASIGWFQSAYGALLISLFGFSFQVLRFATAPFAMGCAVLMYLLARKAGLKESHSTFAALAVTVSPFFIPVAASFMGDVYGFFFTLLCLYAGALAVTGKPFVPLIVCTIAGIIGGTTRQSVWPAVAAPLMVFVYLHRREPNSRIWGTGCLAACGAVMIASQHWFDRQPNREFDSIGRQTLDRFLSDPSVSIGSTVGVLFTTMLYAAPALVCFVRGIPIIGIKRVLVLLGATLFFVGFLVTIGQESVAPWMGNMVTKDGILSSNVALLGKRPMILPFGVRVVLTAGLYFIGLIAWGVSNTKKKTAEDAAGDWPRVQLVLLSFAVLYVTLLVVRANSGYTFDRYAIPLMPVVMLEILKRSARLDFEIPVLAWATAAIFAIFGIAITHDYYSQLRAREFAGKILQRNGIPRRQFTLGVESDAWAQLAWRGFVFNDRSTGEAGKPQGKKQTPGQKVWWFTRHAPDLDPVYFVVTSEVPELASSEFAPVPFDTWLPPRRDHLLIQKFIAASNVAAKALP